MTLNVWGGGVRNLLALGTNDNGKGKTSVILSMWGE